MSEKPPQAIITMYMEQEESPKSSIGNHLNTDKS